MKTTEYTIDASGRTIGRIASEAAKALMGKAHPSYTPHIDSSVRVTITSAAKARVSERKRLQKTYTAYSGFPGGLTTTSLSMLIARKGKGAAIRKAIERMLPRNTFRTARLKRLTITE